MADSQLQCGLFRLPFEIREAIYQLCLDSPGIHLSLQEERIVLSDCITPGPSLDDDGSERCEEKELDNTFFFFGTFPYADTVWARRLRSSWGPHWACDDLETDREARTTSLLQICKRMSDDIVDCLTFHVTDLPTLVKICKSQTPGEHTRLNKWIVSMITGIKSLHVTLRIPLPVFQALDGAQDLRLPEHVEIVSMWMTVWPTISVLNHLRKIEIEIDHLDTSSWSLVNERVILSGIATLSTNNPHLLVVVLIPHLHPLYEDSGRHYTDDGPESSFLISRRTRQRYHTDEGLDGRHQVVRCPRDAFPCWGPVIYELIKLQYDPEPLPPHALQLLQEGDARERADWKRGVDVLKDVDNFVADLWYTPPPDGII